MAWGTKTDFTAQTGINNTTEEFLEAVTLNPYEICDVQLLVDNEHASAVTDALIISLYGTLDASTEQWDTVPFMQFTHKPALVSVSEYVSFTVAGVYKFRIGGKSSGGNDTYTLDGSYRLNGVSA